ncbi:MAG: hypothetical protein R3C11_05635 [Planctomycetaceae bacterium]
MPQRPLVFSGIRVAERRSRFRLWLDRATDRFVHAHVCVSRDVAEILAHQEENFHRKNSS